MYKTNYLIYNIKTVKEVSETVGWLASSLTVIISGSFAAGAGHSRPSE